MYQLHIGFKLLGEFDSIREAKQFAGKSGLSGVFNLIGNNYRAAWYVSTVTKIGVNEADRNSILFLFSVNLSSSR